MKDGFFKGEAVAILDCSNTDGKEYQRLNKMLYLMEWGIYIPAWRPLSLINTDAKLFTNLITNRIKYLTNRPINPYQTGFVRKRLISDNGWISHTVMAHLRNIAPQEPMMAVLLDQEKAYDTVHPEYLSKVLE
jgi:hypothetical protein